MSTEPTSDDQAVAADVDTSSLERSPDGADERATDPAPGGAEEGSSLERPEGDGADPLDRSEIEVDRARVRRAPRYGRFATVGGLLGVVAAFLLVPFAQFDDLGVPWHLDPWGLALVMSVILVPLGILMGCVLALVADRRSRRGVR